MEEAMAVEEKEEAKEEEAMGVATEVVVKEEEKEAVVQEAEMVVAAMVEGRGEGKVVVDSEMPRARRC